MGECARQGEGEQERGGALAAGHGSSGGGVSSTARLDDVAGNSVSSTSLPSSISSGVSALGPSPGAKVLSAISAAAKKRMSLAGFELNCMQLTELRDTIFHHQCFGFCITFGVFGGKLISG